MKITYYGTAAAEGFPGLFCSCNACEDARRAGGRNIRTRSQALIDDALLIDFPADTYLHVLNYGLELRNVKSVLITHGHDDHMYPKDFEYRKVGYAYFDVDADKLVPIPVHMSHDTAQVCKKEIDYDRLVKANAFVIEEINAFVPFETLGYTVTPLEADHAAYLQPRMYIIQKDGKTMLYGHDSGYYPQSTWDYLEKTKPRFDFVSLDCTGIILDYDRGHMGIKACERVRERFLDMGIADGSTSFCLHHFSHNGKLTYDRLKPVADEKGFLVSYDTAQFEF